MPSEIQRFVSYLKDSNAKAQDRNSSANARPVHAADVDFAEISSLLSLYKDDDRIRNVLMDPSDNKLQGALDEVLQELKEVEGVSIAAYIEEAEPLNVLHGQIDSCNQLLERVEGRLGHFDKELNTVNKEIQSLEEDSDHLSVMLRNRVHAADKLGSWLQDTTVPPSLVNAVVDGVVTNGKQFTATLKAVRSKHANMTSFAGHEHLPAFPTLKLRIHLLQVADLLHASLVALCRGRITVNSVLFRQPTSAQDAVQVRRHKYSYYMQGLISTAAERVKAFVMTNIVAMKPRASAGASNAVVRRQSLLEYSEYIVFLQEFAPASHRAVLQRYCEDNGEYLLSTVRAYTMGLFAAVDKKQKPALLTAAESGQRLTGLFSGVAVEKERLHCFEVGARVEELLHPDFSQWPRRAKRGEPELTKMAYRPIPLQSLGNTKVPLEHAFKSLMNQICDAGAGEYAFLRQFFGSDAQAIFKACWKPVLVMVSTEIQEQLQAYNDVIGLLIMTRIVGHCQLLMIHAQAPVMDGFLDRIGLTLWPHYSKLIRTHIESITPDRQNVKAKALKPSVPCVLAPVQRWTRLFISVAKLNVEYSDSQILNNLDELAKALHRLLYRVRLLFAKPMQGHVFHILNLYYLVEHCRQADHAPVRTLLSSEALPQNSGGLGAAVMEICDTFEQNLKDTKKQYKEECLSSHMPDMFLYTMRAEKLLKSGASAASISKELGDVTLIRKRIRDFKDRWKQMVSIIRQEVHTNFAASEACQRDMTHSCLEEMYTQYKSFLEVLNAQGGDAKDAVAEGPTLQTLAYELREMVR